MKFMRLIQQQRIYIVDEAGHAQSKDYDVEAYWDKVFTFIDENIF